MRLVLPALMACAMVSALAGCAQRSDSDPQPPPIPRASTGPVSPDGTYNGQMMNTGSAGGAGSMCGSMDTFTLNIRNGKFRFVLSQPTVPYRRQVTFDLTVAPDGSFASPPGSAYMKGRVAQGHMEGQIVGDACSFDFQADRTGTW